MTAIFIINASMCWFGDMHELMNGGKSKATVDWSAFIYGCFAGFVPWILLIGEIVTSPYTKDYPWYAWAYLIFFFVLFNSFPLV